MPQIRLRFTHQLPSATHDYGVAGAQLCADAEIACLEAFRIGTAAVVGEAAVAAPAVPPSGWRPVFAGEAWVGGRIRPVRCDEAGDVLRVACAGSRAFAVGPGGAWVAADPPADRPLEGSEVEVLIGPALLLALARRGTFALHAAAVATPFGVVALVGESGAGKSTLAAPGGAEWMRVADDILPFGLPDGSPAVFPRYPQLKLPAGGQYPRTAPATVPLAAVCEIGPPAAAGEVAVEVLSPRDGALCLIAHTVAARLFPGGLVEAHLEACAAAAGRVALLRLRYPRAMRLLPEVRRSLLDRLAALGR